MHNFYKSERKEFSEYVIKIFFIRRGLKLFWIFKLKFNPFYGGQYLSQIKLNLYKTFRKTFWGCPKMIQHSKVDQIILNSSQEPSMSSKYDYILDTWVNLAEMVAILEKWQPSWIFKTYIVSKNKAIFPILSCYVNPHYTVILGGHWWFLTGILEDWIISNIKFDIMKQHNVSFLSFNPFTWLLS